MDRKRAKKIFSLLYESHPEARIALDYGNGHELLFAVILSAQCTDVRVNQVTPILFSRFKTIEEYAAADIQELEGIIKSTGFYKQKALRIKNSALMIIREYKGKIPRSIGELVRLPGVGRKTANVVLSNLYGINEGIVVDTHVRRVSLRLGFTKSKNPEIIERDLMAYYDNSEYNTISDLFIFHGRKVCNARSPKCYDCTLFNLCEFEQKKYFYTKKKVL